MDLLRGRGDLRGGGAGGSLTIWHQSGVPAHELAERTGHARPSMSLDVYNHVVSAGEVAKERFLARIDA